MRFRHCFNKYFQPKRKPKVIIALFLRTSIEFVYLLRRLNMNQNVCFHDATSRTTRKKRNVTSRVNEKEKYDCLLNCMNRKRNAYECNEAIHYVESFSLQLETKLDKSNDCTKSAFDLGNCADNG